MAPAPYTSSSVDNQSGSSSSPMVAIKNVKPPTTKTRAPWQLDTFWSSSHRRTSPSKPRSPVLGDSYESSNGFDLADLPLTPPDSGTSAFELHAAAADPSSHTHPRDHVLVSSAAPPPPVLASESVQNKPSKNDIFNSPIAWLTPPSRPVTIPPAGPQTSSSPPPPPSRNSLFFSSFGNGSPAPPSPPPPLPPLRTSSTQLAQPPASQSIPTPISASTSAQSQAQTQTQTQQSTGRKKGHTRNSSLGRASTEECLQEEARIRATKHVDFRLCPTNDFLLGEGRHCSVYLGSYRPRLDAVPTTTADPASSAPWRLCAVKRLHADRQSQLLGLEEAFALRRLGTHPNVIQLIDIRDEVEFAASPQHTPLPSTPEPAQQRKDSASIQVGLSLGLPRSATRSPNGGHASHSRSTSDMTGKDELRNEAQSHKRALAHEKQHEAALARGILHEADPIVLAREPHRSRVTTLDHPQSAILPTPTFLVQGPDGDAVDARSTYNPALADSDPSIARRSSSNSTSAINPPRLLILLELLPNNLALFARKHRERIDLQQWFDWALEIAEALAFLHDKGCVHADIKKENMLLTEDLSVKLCDFNSAVFPNPSDPPRDGLGLGTPAYCAPELSRATGGPGATSFSYPIDIFSLGAVLYSLATGYEPFSKARSVVEMLHRKRLFFESEENDRASRLAVEAGSNPNSQPASRSGSMRGRHSKASSSSTTLNDVAASPSQLASSLNRLLQHSSPTSHTRRDASNDSLESVASSITTISGRNPTSLAVSRLLEPTDKPRGLLVDPTTLSRSSSLLLRDMGRSADVRRCASTGGKKALATSVAGMQRLRASGDVAVDSAEHSSHDTGSTAAAIPATTSSKPATPLSAVPKVTLLELASRPDWLRRRSSYGDELKHHPASTAYLSPAATISEHAPLPDDTLSTTPTKPSRLRTMFSPTSAHFAPTEPASPSPQSPQSHMQDAVLLSGDTHAYADGHPAIMLPGGGRLPDWARDLLRDMLQADPAARPTAHQVRQRLLTHAHHL
ncbi:conserved hypothetical protein [Sporisorium reilianum SRZ2]|uniref:Protein kinase domain-containing protein n=1 Tax=Sporisorium reilianum (strain SRZ2) TaxID=999809 RepID=E6ZZ71_SPORE|nr:conserved hypothetical protein [Sporisorium reilianum SRZ2]